MKRSLLLGLLAAVGVALGWWLWPRPPRNVVLIGIDTLRRDHTSVYGYDKSTTPHLEALAAAGVRFAEATSHAPWTLPSVSTVLTSLHPSEHGAQVHGLIRNLGQDVPHKLDRVDSVVQIARRHGMRTQAFVANAFTGYGIDEHFEAFSHAHVPADQISRSAIEFLRKHGEEPFFLYLHYNDPHEHHRLVPHPHRERFLDPSILAAMGDRDKADYGYIHRHFGFALYDAQVAFADEQVGLVLDALRELGRWDDTLVVVFSDHGEAYYEHTEQHRRHGIDPRGIYGLGHGQNLYQELLSVVLVMAGGSLPEGRVVEGPVGLRDVAPTILDVLHLPAGDRMGGESLLSAIRSGRADREVYSEAIAYGHEKKALRRGPWKYVLSYFDESEELYDLSSDPGETIDLADAHPEQLAAMRARVNEIAALSKDESVGPVPEISDATRRNLRALGYLTESPPEPMVASTEPE